MKPIFLIGIHRSGNTLWRNVFATRPGLLRLSEPRFKGARRQRDFRFFLKAHKLNLNKDEDVDRMLDLCLTKQNRPGLETTFWRFENVPVIDHPELKPSIARRFKESDRSLGAFATILIEEMVRLSGCRRAVAPFPVDIPYVPELKKWFPDAIIMHITRDPRALAVSKFNDPNGTTKLIARFPRFAWLIRKLMAVFVILQYRKFARYHRQFKHFENYRLFRYEDLLADPEKTLREACSFTECEFTPDILEPEKGQHGNQISSLTGKRTKSFDKEAALRWQQVISPFDNWFITLFTRSSMKALDYNPDSHPIFRDNAKQSKRQALLPGMARAAEKAS